MGKYIKPVTGSNIVCDCCVAVNGGLIINAMVEVPSSGGTAVSPAGTAFTIDMANATANGFVGEILTGGTTGSMTPCTLEYDDEAQVVYVKSTLGVAAGKTQAFSGFVQLT